jgi:restriction endonuclease Mrr
MPVPDFQTIMLPLLRFAADAIEHSMTDTREALAKEFPLTPEERAELLPSGRVRRIGLDNIYIQAKRWDGSVGRPELQKFFGALHGKRARKGVFITTGTFTSDARDYVSQIDPRIVLIDGRQVAAYMVEYGLGVTTRAAYELKRIDSDYFIEE